MSLASGPSSPPTGSTLALGARPAFGEQRLARDPGLTPAQQAQVRELRRRDARVRAHERAHVASGGRYVRSGASFTYQVGPDGRLYAVGGEVSIDVSPERDPRDTIDKMRAVERAALAPADPSPQDRAVAAEAATIAMRAQVELARGRGQDQAQGGGPDSGVTGLVLSVLM